MDWKNEKSYIIWVGNKGRDDLEDILINTRIILKGTLYKISLSCRLDCTCTV
jgi:hypothetical protein